MIRNDLARRIAQGAGEEPADLVLKGGTVFDLATGAMLEGDVAICGDTIVGTVESMQLAPNAQRVDVHINIFPRFATLVRDNSRFWNASGFGVDLGLFGGLSVRAESIESLLTGGIGFATPTRPGDPVQHGHIFDLASEPKGDWLAWEPEIPIAPPPE